MAVKNLVITASTTGGIPPAVMARFEEPPLVAMCPVSQHAGHKGGPPGRAGYNQWLQEHRDSAGRVVPGIFERNGGKGHQLGRVCAMGFSNGCILVDELLKFPDAPQLDTVLAVDGIQTTVQAPWIDYGKYVVKHNADALNAPVLVITHTVIVPPNSPSTTQNADIIWSSVSKSRPSNALTDKCGSDCLPALVVGGMRMKTTARTIRGFTWNGLDDGWYDRRVANNFYVFGWGDRGPDGKMHTRDPAGTADHIFQGKYVLSALLDELLVRRWNRRAHVSAVSGFGDAPAVCPPGTLFDASKSLCVRSVALTDLAQHVEARKQECLAAGGRPDPAKPWLCTGASRGYRYGQAETSLFARSSYPAPTPLAAQAQGAVERFFVPSTPFGVVDLVAGAAGAAAGYVVVDALAERFLR